MKGLRWLFICFGLTLLLISSALIVARLSPEMPYLMLGFEESPAYDYHLTYQLAGDTRRFRVKAYDHYEVDWDTNFLGFDPLGSLLFYQRQGAMMSPATCECAYRVSLGSAVPQMITAKPNGKDYYFPYLLPPSLAPDNRHLAAVYISGTMGNPPPNTATIFQIIDTGAADRKQEMTLPFAPFEGIWSADSKAFYFLAYEEPDDWHAISFYRVERETLALKKINQVDMHVDVGVIFNWSPQGRYLAMTMPRHVSSMGVYMLDTHSGQVKEWTAFSESSISWSQDEQWLYLSETTEHEYASLAEIVRFAPATGAKETLTQTPGYELIQYVSPDNEWLFYMRNLPGRYFEDGSGDLWKMQLDGSQQQLILAGVYKNLTMLDQTGQWLFVVARRGEITTLYRMRLDGSTLEILLRDMLEPVALTITPDNRYVMLIGEERTLAVRPDTRDLHIFPGEYPTSFIDRYDQFVPAFYPDFEAKTSAPLVAGGIGLLSILATLLFRTKRRNFPVSTASAPC